MANFSTINRKTGNESFLVSLQKLALLVNFEIVLSLVLVASYHMEIAIMLKEAKNFPRFLNFSSFSRN